MSEEWFFDKRRYKHNPDLVEHVEYLQESIGHYKTYINDLEQANSSMMRLVQLNDQKQALMEASPEFGEELKKLSSPT